MQEESAGSVMDQDILRLCKTKEKQTSGRGAGGSREPDVGKKGGAASSPCKAGRN